MKKSAKILLALLAVIFFAQVCFANYTINPEEQKYTTDYDELQTINEQIENYKRQRKPLDKEDKIVLRVLLVIVIVGVLGAIITMSAIMSLFPDE